MRGHGIAVVMVYGRMRWHTVRRVCRRCDHGKAVVMIYDWLVMRYADLVSGRVDFLQGVRGQEGKSAGGVCRFLVKVQPRGLKEKKETGNKVKIG